MSEAIPTTVAPHLTPRRLTIEQELSLHEVFKTSFLGVDVGLQSLRNGTDLVQDAHVSFTILGDSFEKILKGLLHCTRALRGLEAPDVVKLGTSRPSPKILSAYRDPKDYKQELSIKQGHNVVALLERYAVDLCEIYKIDLEELQKEYQSPLGDPVVIQAFSLVCFYWSHMRYAPLDVLAGRKDVMENEAYKFLFLQEAFSVNNQGIDWKIIPVQGLVMSEAAARGELQRWATALHVLKNWLAVGVEKLMALMLDNDGLSEITTDIEITDLGVLKISIPQSDEAGELAITALQDVAVATSRPFMLGHTYRMPILADVETGDIPPTSPIGSSS